MPLDVVVDAWWGSGGKGKVSAALAAKRGAIVVSSSNHPNAGHTYRDENDSFVFKVLHSASALSSTRTAVISPDSVFSVDQLAKEMAKYPHVKVVVHERATALLREDATAEQERVGHLASTAQGGCAATVRKMWRPAGAQSLVDVFRERNVSRERNELQEAMNTGRLLVVPAAAFSDLMLGLVDSTTVLHEVAQGFALSVDHGTEYPKCTYRNCLPVSALDDLGLPASTLGRVTLVVRTYPIRVGNIAAGTSGDFGIGGELTWEQVWDRAGVPPEFRIAEQTTVTARQRRIGEFDISLLKRAVRVTGATELVVTFAEYFDWANRGARGKGALSRRTLVWLAELERTMKIPIVGVSTGPLHDDMAWF